MDCGSRCTSRSVKTCSCKQPLPGRAGRARVSAASQAAWWETRWQTSNNVYSDETGVGVELNLFPIRTTVIAG